MEILILSDKPPWPADSGGSYALVGMLKQIVRLNHSITLLCNYSAKHPFNNKLIPDNLRKNLKIIAVKTRSGINPLSLLFNLIFSTLPFDIFRSSPKKMQAELEDILLRKSFDLIQFEGLKVCRYIPLARSKQLSAIVYRSHNLEHELWERRSEIQNNFLSRLYLNNLAKRTKLFEIQAISLIDGVISISEDYSSWLKSVDPEIKNITVYPTIISELHEHSRTNDIEYKNNIVFLGSLDWGPNVQGLLWFLEYVLPGLIESNQAIKVIVGGRGADNKSIKKIKSYKVSYCADIQDSTDFLQKGSILIAPLFAGSGVRVKIIEALCLGLEVVTTRAGADGLPDSIRKIIGIADDPSNFAQEITQRLNRIEKNLSPNNSLNKQLYSYFGTFTNCDQLDEFYLNLIDDC